MFLKYTACDLLLQLVRKAVRDKGLQGISQVSSVVDPELFSGSASGIIVPDPGKMKEINKNGIYNFRPMNSGLYVLNCTLK